MKKIRIGTLIGTIALPLLVGILSSSLSSKGMLAYKDMNKPPLSPPSWLFPIAWTILYIMMGLATYFIVVSNTNDYVKMTPLRLYGIQLIMNFMWSIIFFNWDMYLFAFIWLIVMWALVIVCAIQFFFIDKTAAYLLIPYILWLTFAAYLNLGTYVLNQL